MDKIKNNQKYIGIFGILLFGMSVITLGKYNISKLFTTPLGRIWLLFLLIGTSISNYKLGWVLLILILLLHTYINTIEGMDTLTKPTANKGSPPTPNSPPNSPPKGSPPPPNSPPKGSPPPSSTPPKGSLPSSATDPKTVNPDENKLLQGEGANLLDIERNISKNSNSVQVTNKQNAENVLPNNPGKEAFQSNYQLV